MADHGGGGGGGGGCCPPMDLFRSEPMHLVQIIIPIESAHLTASYLGDIGLIQFKDLNAEKSPFQRTYAGQIKRCGEMARKLRYFKDQMSKAGLTPPVKTEAKCDISLDDLEVKLGDLEAELIEINANSEKLQRGYNELVEYKLVLQKAGEFFKAAHTSAVAQHREAVSEQAPEESLETPLLTDQDSKTDQGKQVKLGFLAGLVPKAKAVAFERILFRATRGNVFLKQAALEEAVVDPSLGEKVEKNVFLVFFSGERAKSKILKICEAFGANRYPFAEDLSKQEQSITEVSGRLSELKTTIDAGLLHRGNLLQTIGEQYEQWNLLVRREKAIYHTLNMLSIDVTKKCLVAEGWSPIYATEEVFCFIFFTGMLILDCVISQHGQLIKIRQKEKGSQQVESILMHVIQLSKSKIQIMAKKRQWVNITRPYLKSHVPTRNHFQPLPNFPGHLVCGKFSVGYASRGRGTSTPLDG